MILHSVPVPVCNNVKQLMNKIMEFKFQANYLMSKELTVEADCLADAMDKVCEIVKEPVLVKELSYSGVNLKLL